MSLFKGSDRIAGQTTHTVTPEDVFDKQVVFVDDGDTSAYSDCQDIIDEMTSGNVLSKLFASVKRGLQYLVDNLIITCRLIKLCICGKESLDFKSRISLTLFCYRNIRKS